jgi:hypothetical protein
LVTYDSSYLVREIHDWTFELVCEEAVPKEEGGERYTHSPNKYRSIHSFTRQLRWLFVEFVRRALFPALYATMSESNDKIGTIANVFEHPPDGVVIPFRINNHSDAEAPAQGT